MLSTLFAPGCRERAAAPVLMAGAAAALLAGCSDGPDAPPAEVEIGTAMVSFEPLDDGQPLALVAGPQGGYHFVVHARMRGLSPGEPRMPNLPDNPTTWFRALDESGARVDIPEVRQLGYAPAEGAEGWYTLPSGRIMLIDNAAAPGLYDRPVTLEVQVRDAAGRMAGHAVQIIAVSSPPPGGRAGAAVPGTSPRAVPGPPDAGPGLGYLREP